MNKLLYYVLPFIVFSIIDLITILLDKIVALEFLASWFMFVSLILFAIAVGAFSPAKTKFDYIMPVIIPVAFCLILFVFLFFDEGCDGTPQLSLNHSLNFTYYRLWLPRLFAMAIISFIFSFKPIRNIIKNNKKDEKK